MRYGDYRIEDEPVVTVEEEIEHIVDWIKHYFIRNFKIARQFFKGFAVSVGI